MSSTRYGSSNSAAVCDRSSSLFTLTDTDQPVAFAGESYTSKSRRPIGHFCMALVLCSLLSMALIDGPAPRQLEGTASDPTIEISLSNWPTFIDVTIRNHTDSTISMWPASNWHLKYGQKVVLLKRNGDIVVCSPRTGGIPGRNPISDPDTRVYQLLPINKEGMEYTITFTPGGWNIPSDSDWQEETVAVCVVIHVKDYRILDPEDDVRQLGDEYGVWVGTAVSNWSYVGK